jgi:hypothetical protein
MWSPIAAVGAVLVVSSKDRFFNVGQGFKMNILLRSLWRNFEMLISET